MKNSSLLSPPLRVRDRPHKELESIAELRQYLAGMAPSDVMCQVLIRVLARARNTSMTSFIQWVTGLSRSQLRLGVRRQSTLDRATQRRIASTRQQLRQQQWKPEEIESFETGFPSRRCDFPAVYADWTYIAFFGFGGGEEAISHATKIDRLISDLERAYRDGKPPSNIAQILRDSSVFDAEHFDRPEGQLVGDYSERQALTELAEATAWDEAMPFVAVLAVHCLISLLATFDISIQRYLGPVWSDPIDGSVLTRLFPRQAARAAVQTGRPSRRGLVELPIARLLDFSVRLIYRWRNGQWPRKRVAWKVVSQWANLPPGLLAKWRSGEKPMSATDFIRFWEEAARTPKRQRQTPPVPMPLYLVAILLETYCVTWKKPGQCHKILLLDQDHYNTRRQRLMEAREAGAVHDSSKCEDPFDSDPRGLAFPVTGGDVHTI